MRASVPLSRNRETERNRASSCRSSQRTTVTRGNWRTNEFPKVPTYENDRNEIRDQVGRQEVTIRGCSLDVSERTSSGPKWFEPLIDNNIEGNKMDNATVDIVENSEVRLDPAFNVQDTNFSMDSELGRPRNHGLEESVGPDVILENESGSSGSSGLRLKWDGKKNRKKWVRKIRVPEIGEIGELNPVELGKKRTACIDKGNEDRRKCMKGDSQQESSSHSFVGESERIFKNREHSQSFDHVVDGLEGKDVSISDGVERVTSSVGFSKTECKTNLSLSVDRPVLIGPL
ncbi:hypothetical protein LWI28_006168 [Acer negundo]|uniref:Uncharacterized protein n=1 Tax=Acer negundo TaxID=4023 RepID=A0AAD5NHX3_ACENE|nr:hypothetical protein LWI28_006168 [Acer negundo]